MEERKSTMKNKKKVLEQKKEKQKGKKIKINSDNILKFVFFALLILVVILGIMTVKKYKDSSNEVTANISIPVYETDNQSSVTINAEELTSDYIVKVTNYRTDKVNKEEMNYDVEITNDSGSDIKVTKGDSNKNLMVDEEKTLIEGEKLKKNSKENIYYYISVEDFGSVKDEGTIVIKILT